MQANKLVDFVATRAEYNAYLMKDISNIFSVKIHEPTPTPTFKEPILTLIYPNGGEIWNTGEVVNIRWTSTNLAKDSLVNIFLYSDIEMKNQILIVKDNPNIGSYKWTVNGNTTTHAKIGIISRTTRFSISNTEFTIRSK